MKQQLKQWLSVGSLSCRQLIRGYANKKLELSKGLWSAVDSDLQRAWDVLGYRQAFSVVDNIWILGVFESVSKFVSYPNSEFFVSFSSWTLWLYKKGYCPIDYNLFERDELYWRVLGLVCLRKFYGELRKFSI